MYDLDIIGLPRALSECQIILIKGGQPWKFPKPRRSRSITTKTTWKKNTVRSYQSVIERFCQDFGNCEIDQITPDDVRFFLNSITIGNRPYTKRVRYSHLSTVFNFFRNNIDSAIGNPCDTPMIRKLYRERVVYRWEIIKKETVEEIIFRTTKIRYRLILVLMARGGMWIVEVLKLRLNDMQDQKPILREPRTVRPRFQELEILVTSWKVKSRKKASMILPPGTSSESTWGGSWSSISRSCTMQGNNEKCSEKAIWGWF